MDERTEPSPCSTCGGPSVTLIWNGYASGREYRRKQECPACKELWTRRMGEVCADIERHAHGLSARTANCLRRSAREIWLEGGLRAMSDDDLLCLRNFGRVALAELRSVVGPPVPRRDVPPPDPAEFWKQRHDIFQVVGG